MKKFYIKLIITIVAVKNFKWRRYGYKTGLLWSSIFVTLMVCTDDIRRHYDNRTDDICKLDNFIFN